MKIYEKLFHTFLGDFLNQNSIVLDLGANKGEFLQFIVNNFGSTVYAIEPIDNFLNSIPDHPKIKKLKFCVSVKNEPVTLFLPKDGLPNFYDKDSKEKIICQGITIEKLFNDYNINNLDLLKVDIEGAEIEVFESISLEILRKIDQITIEFHDFLWPELEPRVENIKKKIKDAGFYCLKFSIKNNGDVLFIKKSLITKFEYLYLNVMKYILAFKRVLKRIFK